MGIHNLLKSFEQYFGNSLDTAKIVNGECWFYKSPPRKTEIDHMYIDFNALIHAVLLRLSIAEKRNKQNKEALSLEVLEKLASEDSEQVDKKTDSTDETTQNEKDEPKLEIEDEKDDDEGEEEIPSKSNLEIFKDRLSKVIFAPLDPKKEKILIDLMMKDLINLVKSFAPKQSLAICLDGPAPIAKMQEQKSRRYKKILAGKIESSVVSPGSIFMTHLEETIIEWAKNSKLGIEITISGTWSPGEGEHKVFNVLLNRKEKDANETHAIISPDSDIIPLVLGCERINLYLFLPQKGRGRFLIFNKPTFIEVYVPKQYAKRVCLDIALLCILNGNDYLPKLGRVNPIGTLYDRYLEHGSFLLNYSSGTVKLNLEALIKVVMSYPQNGSKISEASKYIDGILWNMQMYLTGKCPNYEMLVPGKIEIGNLIALCNYNINKKISNVYCSNKQYIEHPLNAHAFSLGILPKEAYVFFDQKEVIPIWEDPWKDTLFDEILQKSGEIGKMPHLPTLVISKDGTEKMYEMKPFFDLDLKSFKTPFNFYKRKRFMTSIDYKRPKFNDFDSIDSNVVFFQNTQEFTRKYGGREYYCFYRVKNNVKFDPFKFYQNKMVHDVIHDTKHQGWIIFSDELAWRKSLKFGSPKNVEIYGFGNSGEFLYPDPKTLWMYFEIRHGNDHFSFFPPKFKFFLDAISLEFNKMKMEGVVSGWVSFDNKELYELALKQQTYLKYPLILEGYDLKVNYQSNRLKSNIF